MSDQDEDVEILALRHQLTILERQSGNARPRFSPGDRAFLAALLHRLPVDALHRLRLLVRPEAVLRWHRDLLARRHAARSRPKRPGRPRTVRSIRLLVLRPARENPTWGYRRIHGELLDRTLIWNQQHLLHTLRECEQFYNTHRPIKASPTADHYNRCHSQPPRWPKPGVQASRVGRCPRTRQSPWSVVVSIRLR